MKHLNHPRGSGTLTAASRTAHRRTARPRGAHQWAAAALGAALLLELAGCSASHSVQPTPATQTSTSPTAVPVVVPGALRQPTEQVLAVAAHAIGVQIYECRAGADAPAVFAWALTGPEAQLRYEAGKELGRHYAGPTWEATDGSKVVGDLVARDDGPDPTALPWLLLRARQNSGNGVFGKVEWIQRVHTAGGKAPVTGCAQAYAGAEVRVAYSADYYFYTAQR